MIGYDSMWIFFLCRNLYFHWKKTFKIMVMWHLLMFGPHKAKIITGEQSVSVRYFSALDVDVLYWSQSPKLLNLQSFIIVKNLAFMYIEVQDKACENFWTSFSSIPGFIIFNIFQGTGVLLYMLPRHWFCPRTGKFRECPDTKRLKWEHWQQDWKNEFTVK